MQHILSCTLCKDIEEQNLHKHYKYTRKDGTLIQKYICRNCSNKKFKKWYSDNPKRFKEIIRKSENKFPEKVKARRLLNYSIKIGINKKPIKCQSCDTKNQRIEAHHSDYSKPLDVVWLCSACHKKQHPFVV